MGSGPKKNADSKQLPAKPKGRDCESISFSISSSYEPRGDQPKAIEALTKGICEGRNRQVLLGVTGSGKTFTMAQVIARLNRPALVLAHNKTLAAQLFSEFSELFPNNAVRYFVSYYDYYQPEAYVPSTDTYIEKDASVNDEIDKLRHAATRALLERRDTIVVASVSCIYGLGDPENYFDLMLYLQQGEKISRDEVLKKLVFLRYERDDLVLQTGTFRVRGDIVEVCPASEDERSIRIEFFGDKIEALSEIDRLTGKTLTKIAHCCIYPASHFITTREKLEAAIKSIRVELNERLTELEAQGKALEAKRLEQRTLYDMELLDEMGFCPGIENYSRHLTGRTVGEMPPTLLDYFPDDFVTFIDESHVTVPQVVGMYRGDRSRKQTLVDYGFRLPSALDNRPLRFEEFDSKVSNVIFVSATPAAFEITECGGQVVEQIIRPTGLIDPKVEVRPARGQVEDLLHEVRTVSARNERILATTLTKKMAEDLSQYFREVGVRVRYLHSDVHTLDRIELIRSLRAGEYDVLVGINLLREGLDIPEVSLVAVLDADKEGFLRSETSLIQTIGRAARHLNGRVILYADKETNSIRRALFETNRRRELQSKYNREHGITPSPVKRAPEALMVLREEIDVMPDELRALNISLPEIPKDRRGCKELISKLRGEMLLFAQQREFEKAAVLRDKVLDLEKLLLAMD